MKESVIKVTPAFHPKHPAPFPEKLIEPLLLAATDIGQWVLDPFIGTGTTAIVALKNQRRCLGFDLDVAIAKHRCLTYLSETYSQLQLPIS